MSKKSFFAGDLTWHQDKYLFLCNSFFVGFIQQNEDSLYSGVIHVEYTRWLNDGEKTPMFNKTTENFKEKAKAQEALIALLTSYMNNGDKLSCHEIELKTNGYAYTVYDPPIPKGEI